jgi:hypothetical protein
MYENPANLSLAMRDLELQLLSEAWGILEPGNVYALDLAYNHLIEDIVAVGRPRSKTRGD